MWWSSYTTGLDLTHLQRLCHRVLSARNSNLVGWHLVDGVRFMAARSSLATDDCRLPGEAAGPDAAQLLNTSSGRPVGPFECTSRCRVEPRAMATRQRCSRLRCSSSGTAASLPFCRCVTWRLAYRAACFQTSFELPERGVLGRNKGEGAARLCDSVAIAFDRQPRWPDAASLVAEEVERFAAPGPLK